MSERKNKIIWKREVQPMVKRIWLVPAVVVLLACLPCGAQSKHHATKTINPECVNGSLDGVGAFGNGAIVCVNGHDKTIENVQEFLKTYCDSSKIRDWGHIAPFFDNHYYKCDSGGKWEIDTDADAKAKAEADAEAKHQKRLDFLAQAMIYRPLTDAEMTEVLEDGYSLFMTRVTGISSSTFVGTVRSAGTSYCPSSNESIQQCTDDQDGVTAARQQYMDALYQQARIRAAWAKKCGEKP